MAVSTTIELRFLKKLLLRVPAGSHQELRTLVEQLSAKDDDTHTVALSEFYRLMDDRLLSPTSPSTKFTATTPEQATAFFARRLKLLRNRRCLSQQELAEMSGCSLFSIKGLESGRGLPSLTTLSKIGMALGRTLSAILDGLEASSPDQEERDDKLDGEALISLSDAADSVGRATTTVKKWCKIGRSGKRLEAVQFDNKLWTTAEAVARFVEWQDGNLTPIE